MKVQLVVAQGVHSGKVIPVSTPQFLIGRDPHCNLRPASPSVSKQHCGIFVRGAKVVVQDYGSTNGTCINGEQVVGEREIANNDKLKIGPLEFVVRIEANAPSSTVVSKSAIQQKGSPTTKTAAADPEPAPAAASEEDPEHAAAAMMALEDSNTPPGEGQVPEGSTVMDIPAVPDDAAAKPPPPPPKPTDTSKTAADILSKYMRRPRT